MRYLITLFFINLFSLQGYAQSGTVEGKITDARTGQSLSGVSVSVSGAQNGVVTDQDGHFAFGVSPDTSHSVRISSVGYQTKEIENVEVAADKIITLNVVLDIAIKTEQEIVIKTTRSKETAAALITYQKNTNTVAQVVSAETIKRSPDKNTGEVLKRIPGTSIQEGKYIIVRGLNDRYNGTMLDGIMLGTTEPDRKTFSFDIFPSGMIDNIIINKAFVPELTGEWAGGLIQINTKDVPAKNYLNIEAGTGFNTQTIGSDFYRYKGGKLDWLGMDDGYRALPDNLPVKSEFAALNPTQKTEYEKSFKNVWGADKKAGFFPLLNKKFQISGGFNKKLGDKNKLGAVFAVNYNQSNRRTDFINNRIFSVENLTPTVVYDYSDKKYAQDVLWGALANITFQLGSNSKISFKNIFNVNATDYADERSGKDYEFNSNGGGNIRATELALKTNTFFNTSVAGDHNLAKYKAKFHWFGSFNILDQYIPDQRRIQYNQDPENVNNPYLLLIGPSQTSQKSGSRYYGFLNDYNYTFGGDLSKSFQLFNLNQTIKGGYFFQVKDRLFDSRPFANYLPLNNDSLKMLSPSQVFAPENFGTGFDNKFAFNELYGDQFRYQANTILNAGFLQLDNQFTDKLRATWGLRVEDYDQVMGSMQQSDKRHVHTNVTDFLPGLNLTYKLNKRTNLRVSGSKTVIRPEFRELSDFAFYDFDLGATVTGNKSLERTKVTNADIRYELYPRAGELFTVGVFYKYFKSPIELFFNQTGGGSSSTFNYLNADHAYSFGAELEFRKKLDFVEALKNFTFQTNISYIYNRVKSEQEQLDRPMQGQSPYVINAALQYDVEKLGINTTLLFNEIGDRIFYVGSGVGNDAFPAVTEQHRPVLDFQIAKKVIRNKGELKLNVTDILNTDNIYYLDINNNRKYEKNTDALAIKRKYGSTISLSFSYNIK